MRELQDTDKMPFGKYKGTEMQDVPADYLHWLWHNGLKNETRTKNVAHYIGRNLDALRQERPDLIFDPPPGVVEPVKPEPDEDVPF